MSVLSPADVDFDPMEARAASVEHQPFAADLSQQLLDLAGDAAFAAVMDLFSSPVDRMSVHSATREGASDHHYQCVAFASQVRDEVRGRLVRPFGLTG